MKTTTVKCDQCETDLTTFGSMPGYRLSVKAESVPTNGGRGGLVFGMMVYPPIDRDLHFCGLGCLRKWMEAEDAAAEAARNKPHVVTYGGGMLGIGFVPTKIE